MQTIGNFRGYFFRGLAALLPTILTIWIFVQCYIFVRDNIGVHINRGLVRLIVYTFKDYPALSQEELEHYAIGEDKSLRGDTNALSLTAKDESVIFSARVEALERYWVHGPGQITGFVVALVAVCIVGAILASVVGKTLWRLLEKFLLKIPVIRRVYPYIKQITDFVLSRERPSFTRVVAIEYPRKGLWSVALVTGTGLKKVVNSMKKDYLTVFVPSSPTPFTGYVLTVAKDDVIDLDMSIEEAMRFVVSGGVITPETEAWDEMISEKKTLKSE
ncbi:MAG: DUF502 domain-containing protein [Planctomycetota bacterium]